MTETVQITFGSQTFETSSSKGNVFVIQPDGQRVFPSAVLQACKGMRRAIPASQDGANEHGMWYQDTYTSQPGILMLLQGSNFIRSAPLNNGSIVLCLRHTAPLITVHLHPAPFRTATFDNVPMFIGRADVLPVDEFSQYGISFAPRYIENYFDEIEVAELFTISEVAPGSTKPSLVTLVNAATGEETKVPLDEQPKRRIRIRKR